MMNTVLFQSSSLAARASSLVARNWAPAAGMAAGCSSKPDLDPMKDTAGSLPLAQPSAKPISELLAGVGFSGSPIPPGVPLPNRVPVDVTALNSAVGTCPGDWNCLQ